MGIIQGGDNLRLEQLRKAAGYSQELIARRLEVSRATIDNWEKGLTEPKMSDLKKIAKLFNVSLDYLMEE